MVYRTFKPFYGINMTNMNLKFITSSVEYYCYVHFDPTWIGECFFTTAGISMSNAHTGSIEMNSNIFSKYPRAQANKYTIQSIASVEPVFILAIIEKQFELNTKTIHF